MFFVVCKKTLSTFFHSPEFTFKEPINDFLLKTEMIFFSFTGIRFSNTGFPVVYPVFLIWVFGHTVRNQRVL